eukprot:scaffold6162_cov154-Cylindrotheca_fusiformis.AAC.12
MSNDANRPMEEDDDPIDDEQLDEYREMVEQLGTFPDKVKINSLSMVAEDHADSEMNAAAIYNVIRKPLVNPNISSEYKLPLVYVIDSILKNVKGKYIPVIEKDAKSWLPIVYQALPEDKRMKLRKVWNLWRESGVFEESKWKEMGSCFSEAAPMDTSDPVSNATLEKAGIVWGKDGELILMPQLRGAMQSILDDLQSDVQDELEKVSLERLASIDSDLFVKIKRTAEDSLRNGNAGSPIEVETDQKASEKDLLSFLVETRTPETIEQTKAWEKLNLNYMKETNDIIASLQHLLRDGSSVEKRYTQQEAEDMTGTLAAAAVTAGLLTSGLQLIVNDEKKKSTATSISGGGSGGGGSGVSAFVRVDKKLFTNDGLKKKNDAVIGFLYEVGLPFVSSADGRRFATQVELSKHLDALFKRSQLEKAMALTEERGWYVSDAVFSGQSKQAESGTSSADPAAGDTATTATAEEEADPSTYTQAADESRNRCVICGINFKMFFDNDDGIFKYSNCREIEVLNDETAIEESEEMLVHVTCWRALGAPQLLTPDQALQETMQ